MSWFSHREAKPGFREKFRSADVFSWTTCSLLRANAVQEEMFHTLTLYEAGRQIVFTADRPPKG